MKATRPQLSFSCLVLLAGLQACGGGGGGGGSSSSQFVIQEVSNGFGRLLPYQIAQRDSAGNPTARILDITSLAVLQANLTAANPIRPPTQWPTAAILPGTNNQPGNHFLYVRFSQPIAVDSVLDRSVNSTDTSNLKGSIQVQEYDPLTRATRLLTGRAFIGGQTYGPLDDGFGSFLLTTWVALDGNGNIVPQVPEAVGFPGTQAGFAGDDVLTDPRTFVFVLDADRNLSTHETFATDKQIQMRINEDVLSTTGRNILEIGLASSTVGPDTSPPEVANGDSGLPEIIPSDGEIDVDPETNIELEFTEPVQLLSIAPIDTGKPPALSSAIQLEFGPDTNRVQVPYTIRPFSIYDLSRLELVPAYNFPGTGAEFAGLSCGAFGRVTVTVNPNQFRDLTSVTNTRLITSSFTTADGQGLVNAPVVPDVVYIGRGGATPGISVVDLNGFGGGTGNPTYDQLRPIQEGNSNFPNNPNVSVSGTALIPPLLPGDCTINGGSEGVFTLTKDSALNDLLARTPILESVGDMAIGHALDTTFNNGAPFGCQAGGGNLCASTGLKRVILGTGGSNSLAPSTNSSLAVKIVTGGENLVSWAPTPNPPPLAFPPLCLSPLILGQEPTFSGSPAVNLLVPGANSRGNVALNRPPTNLLVKQQNAFFLGPSPSQPLASQCAQFVVRQQIGHFLYVIDRVAAQVVVLNSNRFLVVDRIALPDPTSFAMGPNMDLLAVTNEGSDQVSFIDVDPSSSTFHRVVRTVRVGVGPTGIAWEPGNEDIFVCNQADGSVTVISAFSLTPRKTLRNQITRPIDVALTPRQLAFGFRRGVYFGYILNQNGEVAMFESGPDGVNGWGFDDTIGSLPFTFFRPKAIQPDVTRLNSAVWVAHENPLDINGDPSGQTGGALSVVGIVSANTGIQVFQGGPIVNPQFRNINFGVLSSVGEGPNRLSGVPTDIAFDNQLNQSALTNYSTQFSAGQPLSINGKALIRGTAAFPFAVPVYTPQFLFAAVPNPGVIDILELESGTLQKVDASVFQPGLQSISAPNVTVVADFFRQ
ncbi:MAG TPA: hypothetical protein VF530_07180 [Planctomycetota bacterium]